MSDPPVRDPEKGIQIATSDEATTKLVSVMPVPVRKRDFFRAWLTLAFAHAWSRQDSVAGLLALVLPIIAKFIPGWSAVMTDLTWQIPLTVLGTVFVMRLVLAPYWLFRERSRIAANESIEWSNQLAQEKARQSEPKLAGKILCLTADVNQPESQPPGNFGDCWFTMSVSVWNDGGIGTSVTGFRFYARWKDSDWPSRQVEGLDRFFAKSLRPSDPGKSSRYMDEYEDLFDFPIPTELTLTNSQRGWLRFVIRNFPLRKELVVTDDTVITLVALDKKGGPHTVYQGPISSIGECAPIEEKAPDLFDEPPWRYPQLK